MAYDRVVDSAVLDGAMTATANAIREKTGGTEQIVWNQTNGFMDAVGEVYEAGKTAEHDAFWDVHQRKGEPHNYVNKFFAWYDEQYNPKYHIHVNANASSTSMFKYSKITDTKVDIILEKNCDVTQAFYGCSELQTIRKIVCNEGVLLNRAFDRCEKLENVAFEGVIDCSVDFGVCKKMTKTSIISAFSVFSTTATGLTVTFSKAAVDKAFETSEGANDGSTSAEWLALVATRSNWTIALA